MTKTHSSKNHPPAPSGPGWRARAARGTGAALEVLTVALIVLSPWAFGAVDPPFEFLLDATVAVVALLWAVRTLLQGQLTWRRCPVALCLAGLFLLGVWQLT